MLLTIDRNAKLYLASKTIAHRIQQHSLGTRIKEVVNTANGRVKGRQRKTLYGHNLYFAFEGIPFAKPPLGKLRFRAPRPPDPWTGIRDCTYTRSKPLQEGYMWRNVVGSEDCLYLNVYTKSLTSKKPLPVMVWIYGGGFQVGEASRDMHSPDYFMEKDIVLVTLNYRLGALGFLSLSDPKLDVPGNAGIKDQVMAIKWVNNNIHNFNGDRGNITLMGLGAGAVSIQIIMSAEHTQGLFHKVILMSGSSLCDWAFATDSNWPYRLARKLGFQGDMDSEEQILRFLRSLPAKQFISSTHLLTDVEKRNYVLHPFVPVIEPYITPSCVISSPPHKLLARAWGNTLPMIIGGTSFECLEYCRFINKDAPFFLKSIDSLLPREIREASDAEQISKCIKRIKMLGLEDLSNFKMNLMSYLSLLSITKYWHPIYRTLLARLTYAAQAPTYLYRFAVDSPHFNYCRRLNCGSLFSHGACHADDHYYLFYGIPAKTLPTFSMEYRTIKRLIAMWTSFAAKNDPNCNEIHPTKWDSIKSTSLMCLNISQYLRFIELPHINILLTWNSFYRKSNLF